MRARNIKPGFFENEYLGKMPFPVRILFEGLWCMADREGRLEDRPLKIKAKIFPYDKVDDDDETWIKDLLNTLEQSPGNFICRYSINGSKYIQIINFKKHQNPHKREKESNIPGPPKKDETDNQTGFQEEAQPRPDQGKAKAQPRPSQGSLNPDSLIPDSLNTDISLSKDKQTKSAQSSKHFSDKIQTVYLEPLLDIAKKIQGKSNGKKAFNFYQWIQIQIKKKSHPAAMIKAGNALYDYWDTVSNPRGYLDGIMKFEDANANERDHIQTHEALKAEWRAWERSPAAQKISKILQKLARAP